MRHFSFFALVLALSVVFTGSPGATDSFSAEVVAVASADAYTVNSNGAQLKVRLFAADAPEVAQPFGAQARQWVSGVLLQQRVAVRPVAKDIDGATVAAITLANGKDLAMELIAQGLAWADTKNAASQKGLVDLQEKAKAKKLGLWSDPAPVAPWAFRQQVGMDSPSYKAALPAPAAPAAATPAVPASPQAPAGNVTNISVLEKEFKEVEEPDYLMLAAVHLPHLVRNQAGEVLGLTAENISAIPYAKRFGFQDGDVITAVNGERIVSEAQIFAMAERLRGTRRFEVDLIRAGTPHRVNIQVK